MTVALLPAMAAIRKRGRKGCPAAGTLRAYGQFVLTAAAAKTPPREDMNEV